MFLFSIILPSKNINIKKKIEGEISNYEKEIQRKIVCSPQFFNKKGYEGIYNIIPLLYIFLLQSYYKQIILLGIKVEWSKENVSYGIHAYKNFKEYIL